MTDDNMNLVAGASITASILVALTNKNDNDNTYNDKLNQNERDYLVETLGGGNKNISPREILVQAEKHVTMVKSTPRGAWPEIMAKFAEDLSDASKKKYFTLPETWRLLMVSLLKLNKKKFARLHAG